MSEKTRDPLVFFEAKIQEEASVTGQSRRQITKMIREKLPGKTVLAAIRQYREQIGYSPCIAEPDPGH